MAGASIASRLPEALSVSVQLFLRSGESRARQLLTYKSQEPGAGLESGNDVAAWWAWGKGKDESS